MIDEFSGGETAGAIAHRVLLVEDDEKQRETLKELLLERGYLVQTAKDGGQARSGFAMYKPDFVILDLIMPGESGFEICEWMKQQNDSIPVMVLTEITLDDARSLATRVGADTYVTKPVSPDVLLGQIQETAQTVWDRTHQVQGKEDRRVRFNCRCGKRFKVSNKHRGRTLTCPDCAEPLVVPYHD